MVASFVRRMESRHRAWRYRTRIDPAEIAWMREILRVGDVAVDAGAYKGGYTYWMRDSVGATGSVLAFEPQPELAAFLSATTTAFGWTNVSVRGSALCSSPGTRTIHVPGDEASQRGSLVVRRDQARTYEVPAETIDGVVDGRVPGRRVALIKCDVEGNELELFRGARRTIVADAPKLLFECEARFHSAGHLKRVFRYLEDLGYRGSFFWRRELLPIEQFVLDVHQIEGASSYANNFVFEAR